MICILRSGYCEFLLIYIIYYIRSIRAKQESGYHLYHGLLSSQIIQITYGRIDKIDDNLCRQSRVGIVILVEISKFNKHEAKFT
jgi:hypothetical protein